MRNISICYTNCTNMGDAINPYIIRDIFGYNPICTDLYKCEISGIGSGLRRFFVPLNSKGNLKKIVLGNMQSPNMILWSAGFLDEPTGSEIPTRRRIRVASTRGELSKKYVEKILKRTIDCSTGDGGLLVSELIPEYKSINKEYSLGIIPHYKDKDNSIIKELQKTDGAIVIDVNGNPIDTLNTIVRCEAVVSSSLHGLVFSDSLNVPNLHIVLSDSVFRDGFKFNDYYSAYGLRDDGYDFRNGNNCPKLSVQMVKDEYRIDYELLEKKKKEIKAAFLRYIE